MKKSIIFFVAFFYLQNMVFAQELFVYSEPASNMATGSIGFRLTNSLMQEKNMDKMNWHSMPEVMLGISKRSMLHVEGFISNRSNQLIGEGGSLYFKYRFLSKDDVHTHFRMAYYARYSINNSELHQPAIDLNGHNTGIELGTIATKLIHKTAISSSIAYVHAGRNDSKELFIDQEAINFTASIGKLFFPKEYISYDQLNVNGMFEILGQSNIASGQTFLDFAPSVQFIIKSRMRIDLGYRFAVSNDLYRTSPNGGLFRFEYNLFNAF